MKHKFVLLCAILGCGALICALVFSRDNKLQYQKHQQAPATAEAAPVPGLAPNLAPLAETPAPVPAPAAEAAPQAAPKTVAAKAKG